MKKIGIIGALEIEIESLLKGLKQPSVRNVADLVFHIGQLEGVDVAIAQCKVGKVNAARTVQAMTDFFGLDAIINTGIAGAICTKLDIGHVVISSEFIQHDFYTSFAPPGTLPNQGIDVFVADKKLVEIAKNATKEVVGEEKLQVGRIATGDQFIDSNEQKDKIRNLFGAVCAEMEGAAIAQVAYAQKIPFVAIRSISDKADSDAEVDFPAFAAASAKVSEAIVLKMLENY